MDSKSNANKVWLTKLRHDIRIREIDDALSRHRLQADEVRLLPRGRVVLIFTQTADAKSCLAQRDMFRDLGDKFGSSAFMMKYQQGFEDGVFRGQTNLIQAKLPDDVYALYKQSPDSLTSVVEKQKITWFYSTTNGLYLRGPAAAVKPAYDYLDNNALALLEAVDAAGPRENGHLERGDYHHRNGHDYEKDRGEERPGVPELDYAVVTKKKDRVKKAYDEHLETEDRHRDDDNRHAEQPTRREGHSPDERRGRTPEVTLVNAPNYVKAYIRGVYRDALNKMKNKYGVLFRDHPDGTIVEATDLCETGWLQDACQELKSLNREVAGFVKEATIQLDEYDVKIDDVDSLLKSLDESYPEVLMSCRSGNVYMIGDENDLFKAKMTLMETIAPKAREERRQGRRDGHRRRDGDGNGERGRRRKEHRDRSRDFDKEDDSPRREDVDRRGRGDRERSLDRHLDNDYDRSKKRNRSRERYFDDDDSPNRHDDDRRRRRDRDRDRDKARNKTRDKHMDGEYDRPRRRGMDNPRERHLNEDMDRPRRREQDRYMNGDHDRPGKAHRVRDREQHSKDKEQPRTNIAFEHFFQEVGLTLTVQESHLLDQDTEAIVNPTDARLNHGSGLAADVSNEAGSKLRRECEDQARKHGSLEIGDVMVTGGGHLSCHYVLHVLSPKSGKHASQLSETCKSILKKCTKKNIATIAIPPIGPDDENFARAMSDAIRYYVDHQSKKGELREVNLVDPDAKVVSTLVWEMEDSFDDNYRGSAEDSMPKKRTGPIVLQPEGTFAAVLKKSRFLPGHNKYCTILVTYDFPAGVQGEEHPNPGRPYEAQKFVTYIPNSDEGQQVARLLKKAFDQKLLFTFEETEGATADKVIPRDCVRHKMKTSGGVALNGYPDPDYLDNVRTDLANIGFK